MKEKIVNIKTKMFIIKVRGQSLRITMRWSKFETSKKFLEHRGVTILSEFLLVGSETW